MDPATDTNIAGMDGCSSRNGSDSQARSGEAPGLWLRECRPAKRATFRIGSAQVSEASPASRIRGDHCRKLTVCDSVGRWITFRQPQSAQQRDERGKVAFKGHLEGPGRSDAQNQCL